MERRHRDRVRHIFRPHGCPCGGGYGTTRECRCTPRQIAAYRGRISGPLLDRIDLHVDVPPVEFRDLRSERRTGETSEAVRERVSGARAVQNERFASETFFTNARMKPRQLRTHCRVDGAGETLLRQAMDALGLSARAYTKILKVARTIADLEGTSDIQPHHLSEAISYRTLDRALE